jgi:predicted RecB family endonuclease
MEVPLLIRVLKDSIEDLSKARSERDVQDLVGFRLGNYIKTEVRKIVQMEGLPYAEIDLLLNEKVAVEVKLDSQYKEGLEQALILRDIYGYTPVLVHVTRSFSSEEIEALRKIAEREGFQVVVVHLRRREVMLFG